jgi:hypothetical protein
LKMSSSQVRICMPLYFFVSLPSWYHRLCCLCELLIYCVSISNLMLYTPSGLI